MPRTHNLQNLKEFRRDLRNHSTVAEMFLWNKLKGRQVEGLLFRRQFSVGGYILDFYCPELHLAIELDGEVHNQQIDYDKQRSRELLEQHNIKVLRYENHWVYDHLQYIYDDIHDTKIAQQST